jgi:hypothetical protein
LPDSSRTIGELDRLMISRSMPAEITERNGWPEKWRTCARPSSKTSLDLTLTLFDVTAFEKLFLSADATRLLDGKPLLASQEGASLDCSFDLKFITWFTRQLLTGFILRLSKGLR